MLTAHSGGDLAKEYDVAEGQVKKVPMAGHELVGFQTIALRTLWLNFLISQIQKCYFRD